MKFSLMIFLAFNCLPAFSFDGKIIYLKGRSTVLQAHQMNSSELKPDEELGSDTSIVTYDNSVVKIVMDEDSVMTIWPNSKVHISQFINKKNELPGIVGLQTGQVSFTVRKNPKINGYKSKLIITNNRSVTATRNDPTINGDTEIMVSFDSASESTTVAAFSGKATVARSNESINSSLILIGDVLNRTGKVVAPGEYALLPASEPTKTGVMSANQLVSLRNGGALQLNASTPKATPELPRTDITKSSNAEAGWYVGIGLGLAKSSVDTDNIKQELSSRSMAGDGEVHNQNRLAGKIYSGYEFNKYLATEVAFIHLGKSSTELKNVSATNAARLGNIYSLSGKGPALSMKLTNEITSDLRVFAKAGVVHWRTHYFNYGSAREEKINATEFTYGYGLDYKLPNSYISGLRARLDYDFFPMKENSTHLITTGLSVSF